MQNTGNTALKRMIFSDLLLTKSQGHRLAYMAVMAALSVVANMWLEFRLLDIQFSITIVVSALTGILLGPVSGYTIAVLKSLFVLLTRGAVAAAMSASGGIASVTVMLLLSLLPGIRRQYLLLSVFGGAAHNVGQLIAARFIISNQYVWYYLPVLLAAGLLMGAITGMALRVVMPYLDRLSLK